MLILPGESTFSRAFAEFAEAGLAERTHAALVRETLGDRLVGHISRDGTAIEAREKPVKQPALREVEAPVAALMRGRPRKNEGSFVKPGKLEGQQGKPLAQRLEGLPRDGDRGSKCNAQGCKATRSAAKRNGRMRG